MIRLSSLTPQSVLQTNVTLLRIVRIVSIILANIRCRVP